MRGAAPLLLCALLLAACGKREEPTRAGQPDPLHPYTFCDFGDGLQVSTVDRLPASVTYRRVNFPDGSRKVSLADGYRVIFAYPGGDYFANVKVELSVPEEYRSDRNILLRHMENLAREPNRQAPEHRSFRGYDLYAVHRSTFTEDPILSTYTLFNDAARKVVSIYFLTGDPSKRKFKTLEEHKVLRERFIQDYFTCAEGN